MSFTIANLISLFLFITVILVLYLVHPARQPTSSPSVPLQPHNPPSIHVSGSSQHGEFSLMSLSTLHRLYNLAKGRYSQILFADELRAALSIVNIRPGSLHGKVFVIVQPSLPKLRCFYLSKMRVKLRRDLGAVPTMEEKETDMRLMWEYTVWSAAAEVLASWIDAAGGRVKQIMKANCSEADFQRAITTYPLSDIPITLLRLPGSQNVIDSLGLDEYMELAFMSLDGLLRLLQR